MKTAVVLSGGGARGAFQVAALRVLHDAGHRFDAAFGTSTGALQAAGYMVGGVELLERLWGAIREQDIYKRYGTAQIAWRLIRGKQGIYDFEPLHKLIVRELGRGPYPAAYAGVVDLRSGAFHCLPANAETVYASACMPVYASPVNGYVDGGVREVTPLTAAIDAGAESIVCIMCQPPAMKECGAPKNFVDVGVRALDIAVNEIGTNDVVSALEKNEMLQVAEAAGVKLVSPSGKPYRYVPIMVIRPLEELPGSVLGFRREDLDAIGAAGAAAAVLAIQGAEPVRVMTTRAA